MSPVLQYEIKLFLYTKNVKLYQIKFLRDYTIRPHIHLRLEKELVDSLSENYQIKIKLVKRKLGNFSLPLFSLNQVSHCTLGFRRSRLSMPILPGDLCHLRISMTMGNEPAQTGPTALGGQQEAWSRCSPKIAQHAAWPLV